MQRLVKEEMEAQQKDQELREHKSKMAAIDRQLKEKEMALKRME